MLTSPIRYGARTLLLWKTIQKKAIHVAKDSVKIPKELLKLHKEVYLTANIFFVNKIAIFLTYGCNVCFTAVNHLADRKVGTIFKAFKEIYKFYLHRGFRIENVHADDNLCHYKL